MTTKSYEVQHLGVNFVNRILSSIVICYFRRFKQLYLSFLEGYNVDVNACYVIVYLLLTCTQIDIVNRQSFF